MDRFAVGLVLTVALSTQTRASLKLHRTHNSGEVSNQQEEVENVESQGVGRSGTADAIKYSLKGVPAESVLKASRGGARNRADRQSQALNAGQIGNLLAAAAHAIRIDLPLNRMVTIHWEAAGVPLEGMAKATGHFLDLVAKTIARHGYRTAWLWVHENGAGKGGHCHALIHVPPKLAPIIAKRQRGWLRTITGRPYVARGIRSRPISGSLGRAGGDTTHYQENLKVALGYLVKCADPEAVRRFRLVRVEDGGLVIGKRCGTSQNIGAKARDVLIDEERGPNRVGTSRSYAGVT